MRTLLPEWVPQEAILMSMPNADTDWNYILEEARAQYLKIIKTLTEEGVCVVLLCKDKAETAEFLSTIDERFLILLEADYNDTWT